ncbi:hypothetical protein ACFY5A_05945 [Microbacterium sp. NPDC012755]|uniref:hypothetical protein n=1 Tax=Microbacterium sp. NPDC012755 TaxID=3364184 RepID=UPI0036A59A48
MDDLPRSVVIGGAEFSRVDSDDSIACWTSTSDVDGSRSWSVSIVIEPAAAPDAAVRERAATVCSGWEGYVEIAADYLLERLREPQFALEPSELVKLDAAELPFDAPEAVIWGDGSWMLRFAESSLEMADPFGIGVRFEGTTATAVEDLSDADPV